MTLQQMRYAITIAECKSMNQAAQKLFISQPSLSTAIRELEEELGMDIFIRSNRGVLITPLGEEFLGYARQVTKQYELLEDRYFHKNCKKKFSVSSQHYAFAVKAFVETVKSVGMDEYEFAIHETRTQELIDDVRNFKSEIGVLYLDTFNEKVMSKILMENNLEFVDLFSCHTCVYLWSRHPLAMQKQISMEELEEYPCLAFEQRESNSFFLSEEVMSTYEYKQIIKASDRATLLNLMVGLNGYTLCSGIICEELNGNNYRAVPLKEGGVMRIGYIKRKGTLLTPLAQTYIQELEKCNVDII